jgi:malate dehydrogenase
MPVVEAKRVAVLGAAGGIGQPLSLLLKMNKCVTELALFDVAPLVKGVAADLSHCNTPVQVGAATWPELAAEAVSSSFVDQE